MSESNFISKVVQYLAQINSTLPDPVPLPAAVWLFGSGLVGSVGVARKKKVSIHIAEIIATPSGPFFIAMQDRVWPKAVIPSFLRYYESIMVQSTHNKRLQLDAASPRD